MAENGASSARMRRAAHEVVTVWKETAENGAEKRWVEALHEQISTRLATAERLATNYDARDPGAAKHAKLVTRSLRAARDQVAAEADKS